MYLLTPVGAFEINLHKKPYFELNFFIKTRYCMASQSSRSYQSWSQTYLTKRHKPSINRWQREITTKGEWIMPFFFQVGFDEYVKSFTNSRKPFLNCAGPKQKKLEEVYLSLGPLKKLAITLTSSSNQHWSPWRKKCHTGPIYGLSNAVRLREVSTTVRTINE